MDREGVQDVDIARGLADTAAMLETSAGEVGTGADRDLGDLPRINGYGSQLNQVWEKLIDNAIDAARRGNVTVTATRRGDFVVVRVTDDGPAFRRSTAIASRTVLHHEAGRLGNGLGLDIARRFAHLNDGDLDFSSQPGHGVSYDCPSPHEGVAAARASRAGALLVAAQRSPRNHANWYNRHSRPLH
jgi:signal transduction histidine kinase